MEEVGRTGNGDNWQALGFCPCQGFVDFDDFVFRAMNHQCFGDIRNVGWFRAVGVVMDGGTHQQQ